MRLMIISFFVLNCFLAVPLFYSKAFNKPVYVDPEFQSYLNNFHKDSKKFKVDINYYRLITVFSNSTTPGQLGYCMPHLNVVVISRRSWEAMNTNTRKLLLYHEWAHCLLRREHSEEAFGFPTYCPVTIMHPFIEPSQRCYNKNTKEFYDRELFTNPYKFQLIPKRKE